MLQDEKEKMFSDLTQKYDDTVTAKDSEIQKLTDQVKRLNTNLENAKQVSRLGLESSMLDKCS